MNTKKHLFSCFTILFSLAIIVSGCHNNKQGKSAKLNDIRFDSVQVEKEYYLLNNPQNPHCELKINFIYPDKSSSPEVLAAIQKDFVNTFFNEHFEGLSPKEAVDKFTEEYLKEYTSLEEPFKEDLANDHDAPVDAWYSYTETRYNEIYYNHNNIVSYCVYREGYTGGAHGSHTLKNRVIDLSTGLPVTEKDIFVEGYQDHLTALLIKKITERNELKDPKELEDIGYFSIDDIYPNNNFLVDDSGLIYDFNEYEIAAYVVGITSVEIPYQEIRHILLEDSPISHLVN